MSSQAAKFFRSRRSFLSACAGGVLSAGSQCHLLANRFDESRAPTFAFRKIPGVLLARGPQGAFDSTHAKYPSVLRVGQQWMMWYNGRADDAFTGSIGLATSSDGLKWTKANDGKPVFTHGGPGTSDETKVDHPAVLHFDGRFHMWYTAGDLNSRYKIGYAVSPDGYHWQRQNEGRPVLGPGAEGKFDDQVVLHPAVVRDAAGVLHIWYNGVGPQKVFEVGHATSRDGIHWKRENDGQSVLRAGRVSGNPEEYVYNVMVLLEDGVYRMWYSSARSFKLNGRNAWNGSAIVYAESRDGTHWKRDTVQTLVCGEAGSDDAYACFAPYVVRRDDGLWMYYSMGSEYRHYQVGFAKCPLKP